MEQIPLILDPCCGSRMMWFDRGHTDVIFGDRRRETLTVTDRSHGRKDGTRSLCIEPDAMIGMRGKPRPSDLVAKQPLGEAVELGRGRIARTPSASFVG